METDGRSFAQMLGAAGIVIPEAFNRSGLPCGPEAVWWKVRGSNAFIVLLAQVRKDTREQGRVVSVPIR